MHSVNVPILGSQNTIADALKTARERGTEQILVHDAPFGWSSIDTSALENIAGKEDGTRTLAQSLPEARMPHIYPDNRLEVALRHAPHWPFLAVMHRADPRKIVGLISMEDILKALGH
jgi:CBS domain-containing protein